MALTAIAILHHRSSPPRPFTNTREGYGLTSDSAWITYEGQNALWLPPKFRPWCSAFKGSAAALGCISGRVLVFQFAERPLWLGDG
ncbi:hypothetical protein BR93DRAFT_931443 [Coniochaeta sp. PMI_546]|nr:hypothetical protein BR93DRAFT_931443 [Coniochaeta sp. PMI_546]